MQKNILFEKNHFEQRPNKDNFNSDLEIATKEKALEDEQKYNLRSSPKSFNFNQPSSQQDYNEMETAMFSNYTKIRFNQSSLAN